jgi:PIN domain nuclease of toxin-antitoxin system
MPALLLDTCAVIYIAENQAIASSARRRVIAAGDDGGVLVSPVSAWEIGLLASRRGLIFLPDPKAWFIGFLASPGVRLTPLTPEIAIESSFLAPPLHNDPADRLLVATACALGVPIVTRDLASLEYARRGFVSAIAC